MDLVKVLLKRIDSSPGDNRIHVTSGNGISNVVGAFNNNTVDLSDATTFNVATEALINQRRYDLEKSQDYGVRTTDHDKLLTYTMGGLDILKDAKSGIQSLFEK